MDWLYFDMIPMCDASYYLLVDEEGQILSKDDSPVYFDSFAEAEAYLVEHDIRGTVR